MSNQPLNKTFKAQQSKLVRATFKKGFINAVHASSNTVDVTFAENPLTVVKNIPVPLTIDISDIAPGQRCKIDVFDETNPNDMVLSFTY